jgi:hypothetical protein
MQPRHLALLAALSLAMTHTAGAQVYRCTAAGKTTYTDQPCVGGRMVETDVNSVREIDQTAARAASAAIDRRMQERRAVEEMARQERVRQFRDDQSFAAAMAAAQIPQEAAYYGQPAPYYGYAGWAHPNNIAAPPRLKPVKPVAPGRYIEINKK